MKYLHGDNFPVPNGKLKKRQQQQQVMPNNASRRSLGYFAQLF